MRKIFGSTALIVILTSVLLSFTSCTGGLTPQEYIQYEMDASYKNTYNNKLLNIYTSDITQQTLIETYNENMKRDALLFLSTTCGVNTDILTEQTIEKGASIFKTIYESAKYDIGDSEESGDNFTVDMTIYPINIIVNTITQEFYDEQIEKIYTQHNLSEQELENEFAIAMLSAVQDNISNLSYAPAVNITVLLENKGDYFELSLQSWQEIESNILLF